MREVLSRSPREVLHPQVDELGERVLLHGLGNVQQDGALRRPVITRGR